MVRIVFWTLSGPDYDLIMFVLKKKDLLLDLQATCADALSHQMRKRRWLEDLAESAWRTAARAGLDEDETLETLFRNMGLNFAENRASSPRLLGRFRGSSSCA